VTRDLSRKHLKQRPENASMKKAKPLRMGATKTLTRSRAIEEYVVLRIRANEINRLDYLLKTLSHKRVVLPDDSLYSTSDLADTVRTCFMGWFATLTDRDNRAVYAFDCLLNLFPDRRPRIIAVQLSLEACHVELQQFRNNVAFHARSDIAAHFQARMGLQHEDIRLDLVSAINEFGRLMETLIGEETTAIPELPSVLEQMRISHLPIFSRYKKSNP
jgi:hypothetical protein